MQIARWLVDRGARSVALVSRRGARGVEAQIETLREGGVDVRVVQADVSRRDDLTTVMREIQTSMPPLVGVIHAAGVVDDRVLMNHDWARFERVFAPKVAGGWLLHELTQDLPLDFFVLFSSAASVLGPVGLANYAAANAFLDALAHARRAAGLPAVSIDWSAWEKTGMAAAVGDRRENQWVQSGFDAMTSAQGLELLERTCRDTPPQLVVLPVDWPTYMRWLGEKRRRPFYRRVEGPFPGASVEVTPDTEPFKAKLERTLAGDRPVLVRDLVASEVRRVLGFDAAQVVDLEEGFFELGMDSLTAVELKNRLQTVLDRVMPTTVVFDHPTISALAGFLTRELLGDAATVRRATPARAHAEARHGHVAAPDRNHLSEDDLAAMLAAKLGELN
jgi:acyl carrier protein